MIDPSISSTHYAANFNNAFTFQCSTGFARVGSSEHGGGDAYNVTCQLDTATNTVYWDFGSLKCTGTPIYFRVVAYSHGRRTAV